MEIKFEKACTGEYSIIHAESVIKTEDEFLLVGKIENSEYNEYDLEENEQVVVGVLQDKSNSEMFYMYETVINLEEYDADEDEYEKCELSAKMKFYLNIGEEVFPWVSRHFNSVMIPDGTITTNNMGEGDGFGLSFLSGLIGSDQEFTLYL